MGLREEAAKDISEVFLNEEDFAEEHCVEGKETICVISSEDAMPMAGGFELGVAADSLLLFCSKDSIERKEPGQSLNIDGSEYIIERWSDQVGMHVVTLSQTMGV